MQEFIERGVNRLEIGAAALGLLAGALWGQLTPLIQVLIVLMMLHVAAALVVTFGRPDRSFRDLFPDLRQKTVILILVGAAAVVARPLGIAMLSDGVTSFFIMHVGLSLVESAGEAGVPVPKAFKDALRKFSPEPDPGAPGVTASAGDQIPATGQAGGG